MGGKESKGGQRKGRGVFSRASLLWPALVLLTAIIWIASQLHTNEPYVLAATVTAAGVIGAACVTIILWRLQERARATVVAQDMRIRQRKLLIALRAEIALNFETLSLSFSPENARRFRLDYMRLVLDDRAEMPVGVTLKEHPVFDMVKAELPDLPGPVIRTVVRHYQSDQALNLMAEAFAHGLYDRLDDERQLQAVDEYFSLGFQATIAALEARCTLDAAIHDLDGARRPAEATAEAIATYCSGKENSLLVALRNFSAFTPSIADALRNPELLFEEDDLDEEDDD